MSKRPPRYLLQLFRWFCHPDYVEDIEGDLMERFEKRAKNGKSASWLFAMDILKLIRPGITRKLEGTQKLNYYGMLKHNLKVAIRNFSRHKTSFLINLTGLTGGLVAAMFIYLWVDYELNVDTFHTDSDRIYRLVSDNAGNATLLNTSPLFANGLANTIPEIELLVNSSWGQLESSIVLDEEVYSVTGEFATEGFFQLFSYPLIEGANKTILQKPNAIVLSESTARKLFNTTDVVGKTLEWRWFSAVESVEVTGVYKDPPNTSSAQFDYVLSFKIFERRFQERIERGNRNARSFIRLAKGTDVTLVNQKIQDYSEENYPESTERAPFLIGYSDYYLHGIYENGKPVGGRIELVRLFVLIGALILLIACVNFMNLSTARATLRTKEIGVKKVMGAHRRSLIYQYLTESSLISLFSGISALLCILVLFPAFQRLVGQPIAINYDPWLIIVFLGIIFLTGVFSGSYPAFYLSKFKPLVVLKGHLSNSVKDQWFRKGLVIFQFTISLILIIAVIVIYRQMEFVQSKSLGYTKEGILNFETKGMNSEKQRTFLNEVRRLPGVDKASGASHALFGGQRSSANISWTGKDPEQNIWFEWGHVGFDMLELLQVELDQGRFFSRDYGDEASKMVINEATRDLMETDDPIGKKITVGETDYEIIGVTKDFHFQSLHEKIKPTFFLLNDRWSMKIALRLQSDNLHSTIDQVEAIYSKLNPGFAFEYSFHDEDTQKMYSTEQKVTSLSRYAAGLAILISCLGLFGLVSFIAERKSKEMGLRKVLGAGSIALIRALSKDFVSPIIWASIVSVMASVFLMENWLNGFAYRIHLQWWFFALAVSLMLLLALITTSTQFFKVIKTNPAETLKDE